MLNNLILLIKGFFIGIANIIPGVSGGTLMITLGVYEQVIGAISHFFKYFKKNIKFLIPIGIGAVLSILLMSKVIGFCLEKYPFPTTLFFIGLILGGIPLIFKKVKGNIKSLPNWLIFLSAFSIVLVFTFISSGNRIVSFSNLNILGYIMLIIVGVVASATMIIPGISGSFMLMLMGYYKPIIDTIRDLTNLTNLGHNLMILIPFGIGILVGIVLVAKLIEYLLKKYEIKTYAGVLGFVIASVIAIIVPLDGSPVNIYQIGIGILLLGMGYLVAYKLGDK
ncbi:MAG: DUF368 domain-containing protein [Bacilli bacterium]